MDVAGQNGSKADGFPGAGVVSNAPVGRIVFAITAGMV